MPEPTTQNNEPGAMMNVREVHGAIMRERNLPGEKKQRVPWYLHLLYVGLVLWAYVYFAVYGGKFDWGEYEHRPDARSKREFLKRQAAAAQPPAPVSAPTP